MERNRIVKLIFLILHSAIFFKCSSPVSTNAALFVKQEEVPEKPYSNPALMNGSSFGHYLQSLYRFSCYEDMTKFTASGCVSKFGQAQLVSYYQNKFKFDFELGKLSNLTIKGDTFLLSYSKAQIDATRRLIRIAVVIENDSAKLILQNLNTNPFY